MRHIELGCQCRIELVDVPAVSYDALAVCDVKVSRYFVHQHLAADRAALIGAQVGEVLGAVVYALCGVAQDVRDAPLLALVRLNEVVAGVAAPHVGAVGSVTVAAIVGWQVLHFQGTLFVCQFR